MDYGPLQRFTGNSDSGSGWVLTLGDLVIDYNKLEDGVHTFSFDNGELTGYSGPGDENYERDAVYFITRYYVQTGGWLHTKIARDYAAKQCIYSWYKYTSRIIETCRKCKF